MDSGYEKGPRKVRLNVFIAGFVTINAGILLGGRDGMAFNSRILWSYEGIASMRFYRDLRFGEAVVGTDGMGSFVGN